MKRRFFLLAAPAIVAAPSLMRVSTLPWELATGVFQRYSGFEPIALAKYDWMEAAFEIVVVPVEPLRDNRLHARWSGT